MATAEVADAKAALQRAEAALQRAEAEVADAKALAATNVAYAGMYVAAQNGYAAAQNGYAAAQQTLQTAMQRVIASGSGGSVLNDATRYNYELPTSLEAGELFNFCPKVFLKDFVFVRQVWKPFYTKMSEVTQGEVSMVHVSGNPGIGKSHFLIYVLVNLLKEGKTVQVELVKEKTVDYYAFYPDGTYQILNGFNRSLIEEILLTDQKFVGHYGRITYLFASPHARNWTEAQKNRHATRFQTLFMPPWSLEELETFFYRYEYLEKNRFLDPRTEFRVRNLLFGPIPRWYFAPELEVGYQEIVKGIQGMVGKGVLQAQDLKGAGDKGEFTRKVFAMWPRADFLYIQSIRPVSEWVSQSIAEVAAYKKLEGFEAFILAAEGEPLLRVAAGNLFERYAHHRLAQGGTYKAVGDGSDVVLETRRIKYFSGLAVSADPEWSKDDTMYYWVPRNPNFSIIDSLTSKHMYQISLAKSRKPMDPAVFHTLQSDLNQDAYMVLVKLEGDTRSIPDIKFRTSDELKVLSNEDKQLVLAGCELSYRQIQAMCKKYGIRANQPKQVMVEELVALANVQDVPRGRLQEQLRPNVKTIALRSDFSVDSEWRYSTLEELFTSVKNDIHYGDCNLFLALEDAAVEDNGNGAMDNWDIKLDFHGGGTASGFESEIVYTALMEETQVTLKLAHLDGTLVGKQVRVKAEGQEGRPLILGWDSYQPCEGCKVLLV